MEKPISLREETWNFLLKKIGDSYKIVGIDNPFGFGPLLFKAGILKRPDLLQETAIELDNDAEYLIDKAAADDLFSGKEKVLLLRLSDTQKIFYSIDRKRVIHAIKDGSVFDQLKHTT